jgi:hypothetical protein
MLQRSTGSAVIRELLGNFSNYFFRKKFSKGIAVDFFVTRACPGHSRDGRQTALMRMSAA